MPHTKAKMLESVLTRRGIVLLFPDFRKLSCLHPSFQFNGVSEITTLVSRKLEAIPIPGFIRQSSSQTYKQNDAVS